jgi:hypothetical protein
MENKIFQWQIKNGQPMQVGGQTVTPQARVTALRLPFWGFVWNRPIAVLVEDDGRVQRLPIPDMTRMIVLAVVVMSAIIALLVELQEGKE